MIYSAVLFKLHSLNCFSLKYLRVKLRDRERCLCQCLTAYWETGVKQASPGPWIICLSVVDIYKLNANVIVSIDHLFSPLVPAAWVCFVFSQHFKVKPEKIKSWNHYCERSEHKYFIIWYFLCKIEFMHSDAGAVRIQKYQATVSVSRQSKFMLWWREEFFCWMSKLRPDFEQWWVKNGTAALLCSLCSSCLA